MREGMSSQGRRLSVFCGVSAAVDRAGMAALKEAR